MRILLFIIAVIIIAGLYRLSDRQPYIAVGLAWCFGGFHYMLTEDL